MGKRWSVVPEKKGGREKAGRDVTLRRHRSLQLGSARRRRSLEGGRTVGGMETNRRELHVGGKGIRVFLFSHLHFILVLYFWDYSIFSFSIIPLNF